MSSPTIKLYHIPEEKIEEIKQLYLDGNIWALISKWNEYEVTTEPLCYCPDSEPIIHREIPALWS